MAPVGVKGLIT